MNIFHWSLEFGVKRVPTVEGPHFSMYALMTINGRKYTQGAANMSAEKC